MWSLWAQSCWDTCCCNATILALFSAGTLSFSVAINAVPSVSSVYVRPRSPDCLLPRLLPVPSLHVNQAGDISIETQRSSIFNFRYPVSDKSWMCQYVLLARDITSHFSVETPRRKNSAPVSCGNFSHTSAMQVSLFAGDLEQSILA
jgi:hypothetical protein